MTSAGHKEQQTTCTERRKFRPICNLVNLALLIKQFTVSTVSSLLAGMTNVIYLPVLAPVHVRLVQVTEQCEFVVPFADSLECAAPLAHSSLLLVLIVQSQALFHLHNEPHCITSILYIPVMLNTVSEIHPTSELTVFTHSSDWLLL